MPIMKYNNKRGKNYKYIKFEIQETIKKAMQTKEIAEPAWVRETKSSHSLSEYDESGHFIPQIGSILY